MNHDQAVNHDPAVNDDQAIQAASAEPHRPAAQTGATLPGEPLRWTSEYLSRFWDFCSQRPDADDDYFASQFGDCVVAFLQQLHSLAGREVLDYGCGAGHLDDHLLQAGANVSALDFSPRSVQLVQQRFANHPGWRRAVHAQTTPTPLPSAHFDVVCCLETIEHVLDEHLDGLFDDVWRLTRPDGHALFTTPHNEPLLRSTVFCPSCEKHFHRWQHVRSWDVKTLSEKMRQSGFEIVFCQGINFRSFGHVRRPSWKDISPRLAVAALGQSKDRLLDRIAPREFPAGRWFQRQVRSHQPRHLVAVGKRI